MGRDARFKQDTLRQSVAAAEILDRFNRPIRQGDLVHILNKGDTFWQVGQITPMLDPAAPAGLLQVMLTSVIVVGLRAGVAIPDLIKCQEGAQHSAIQPPDDSTDTQGPLPDAPLDQPPTVMPFPVRES